MAAEPRLSDGEPRSALRHSWRHRDPITTGLAVRVAPDGKKTFSVRYRAGRQQRRLTLGAFPLLTLAKARKRAEAVLASVLDGEDPAAEKAEARTADTVAELALTYIDKHAKPKKKSWNNDQRILDTEVLPHWKNRLARDITRRDVRELIEDIAERGPIFANRVRALLHTGGTLGTAHLAAPERFGTDSGERLRSSVLFRFRLCFGSAL